MSGHRAVAERPGFVTAHSHAFQRAIRAQLGGDDFWGWRDGMLAAAAAATEAEIRASYARVYREMLRNGYTAVGEFHYLGLDAARAALGGARETGIAISLLHVAYARGGIERFRQPTVAAYLAEVERLRAEHGAVGVAPHSVRACPEGWLRAIGRYADGNGLPLHVHASEQPREVADCLAETGRRPIELLADTGCLTPRTTVVHATHATEGELDLIAQAGAHVCLCPTTEGNLGDGFPPLEAMLERSIPLCIGSDSNVRLDPLEELRELETTARRQTMRRNVIPVPRLMEIGSVEGAVALRLDAWPSATVDLSSPQLTDVDERDLDAALVFGCSSDVFV
jgi:formimidoylglutamate deiminase